MPEEKEFQKMEKRVEKDKVTQAVRECARRVRETNPMAPSITNNVTIQFVANAQLAVGGSAAIGYLSEEAVELAKMGGVLYINLGTLTTALGTEIPAAAAALQEAKIPWVLDPVGIGLGSVRAAILTRLKASKPSIVRGNASEILQLAKTWGLLTEEDAQGGGHSRGVDSTESVASAKEAAKKIARYTGGAVSISGPDDLVTDGRLVAVSHGGSRFMPMITGAGCSLGGVTAVYRTQADAFTAALTAVNVYNLAGRRAEDASRGPGSFYARFLDELYLAKPEEIAENPFDLTEE